jgi:hypothetical protein
MFPTIMSLNVWGVATQRSLQLPPQSGRVCNFMTCILRLIVDNFFSLYRQMPWLARILGWRPSLNASRSSLHVSLILSDRNDNNLCSCSTLPIDYIRIIEIKGNFDTTKMQQATGASYTDPTRLTQNQRMWFA